jgi:hypothetical protein
VEIGSAPHSHSNLIEARGFGQYVKALLDEGGTKKIEIFTKESASQDQFESLILE